jgi:predicted transcriptional regulator of viral defense system
LKQFPRAPHEDLFVAWLAAGPRAVISHDSALALYELSDALPVEIHVTAPRTASRRRQGFRLHTNSLASPDITTYGAMKVTTPARTIIDVASAGLADELIIQAAQQALARGLVTADQLLTKAAARGPSVLKLIQRAIGGFARQ